MPRSELESLEATHDEPHACELLVALVWLCLPELPIAGDELNAARRRAMFVLAAGGDPYRELGPDSVAAGRLAAELDTPERRKVLHTALSELDVNGLPTVAAGVSRLLGEPDLAWRCLGLALLADELADE